MNFVNGTLESAEPDSATVRMGDKSYQVRINAVGLSTGTKLEIGIRPEHTKVVDHDGENVIAGKIEFIEKLGEASYLYVSVPNADDTMTVRQSGDTAYNIGDTLLVYLQPDVLHAFKEDGRACARTIRVDSVKDSFSVAGVAGAVVTEAIKM
jgi:multiple sugar transport system ATP-binding protein